jgi:cytochrome c556
MKGFRTILTAVVLIGGLAGGVFAHEGATGIIKERMESMKAVGEAMKMLTAMFQGKTQYDAAKVREAARAIQSHSGEHLTKLFPKGTGHKPSEALPAVWQEWDRFSAYAKDLQSYAETLEAAADNPGGQMHGGGMMGGGASGQGQGFGGPHMQGQGWGGGPGMGGNMPAHDPESLKQMPAMASYMQLTRTCNACHTRFRIKQ